jgi:uncharacterized protein DUF6933
MTARPVLDCTAKLLRELDPKMVQPDPGDAELASSWCLNLIRIEGKKCLLATHEETRFAVFVPNVVRRDLRQLPALFAIALEEALVIEGIPPEGRIDPASAVITRADIRQRSILGCMNEIALHCRLFIEDRGGLSHCDLTDLRRPLNDALHKGRDGQYGTARERLAQRGGP